MTKVVVIKFKNGGKLYYFSPRPGDVYERNMPVVVETARGLEFAWVAYPEREVEDSEIVPPLKSIVRIANQRDKDFYASCEAKKPQAMSICKEKIAKHELDMKLIDCRIHVRRHENRLLFHFFGAGRLSRAGQRPRFRISYPNRTPSGRHAGRNEISRRNRALRAGVLLRGEHAGI